MLPPIHRKCESLIPIYELVTDKFCAVCLALFRCCGFPEGLTRMIGMRDM